jgi:glycine/D-amino acid oxidase-like deaminating enzyme
MLGTHRIKVLPSEVTDSGWFSTLNNVAEPSVLKGTVHTDFLVIGAGWVGVNAARRLAEVNPDKHVVLIDAGRVGNSTGGRCAGYAIDLAHNPRKRNFAESESENMEESYMNREGIDYLRSAVEELGVECDWSPEGKIHVSCSDRGDSCLKEFARAMDRIGEPYEWYEFDKLKEVVGTSYYRRGMFTPGTVLLQPAAMLRGIVDKLPSNAVCYENSPVVEITYGTDLHTCITPNGEIHASKIVLANNGFISYFGFFEGKNIPIYTYGSLTRPLTESEQSAIGGQNTFGLIPADPFGTTVRRTADNRLFIRNIYKYARDFKTTLDVVEMAKARHQQSFDARFPEVSSIGFEHSWGGGLSLSMNGGTVFGEISDRVYAAAFLNGTGVARGAIYGKAIAELASGQTSRSIQILSKKTEPSRPWPRAVLEPGVNLNTNYRLFLAGKEV